MECERGSSRADVVQALVLKKLPTFNKRRRWWSPLITLPCYFTGSTFSKRMCREASRISIPAILHLPLNGHGPDSGLLFESTRAFMSSQCRFVAVSPSIPLHPLGNFYTKVLTLG